MKKLKPVPMSRIAVDTRDASKDIFIPTREALERYERGELAIDVTNSKPPVRVYCYVARKGI